MTHSKCRHRTRVPAVLDVLTGERDFVRANASCRRRSEESVRPRAVHDVPQDDIIGRKFAHDFEFFIELFQFRIARTRDQAIRTANDDERRVRAPLAHVLSASTFFFASARGVYVPFIDGAVRAGRDEERIVIVPRERLDFSTMTSEHRDGFERIGVMNVNRRADRGGD